nr:hypothetical protein [Prolixibacteraceae bacterium]
MRTSVVKTVLLVVLWVYGYTGTGQSRVKGDAVRVTYRQVVNGQDGRRGASAVLLAPRRPS